MGFANFAEGRIEVFFYEGEARWKVIGRSLE